jgi:hypothetical protein
LKELFNISFDLIFAFVGFAVVVVVGFVVVVVVIDVVGFVVVVAPDLSNPNHQNRPKRPKQKTIHFLDYSETEKKLFCKLLKKL